MKTILMYLHRSVSEIFKKYTFSVPNRFICNKYLLKPGVSQENRVEWGYCFDVHLNALFPLLVLLHGVVILLYHGNPSFVICHLSCVFVHLKSIVLVSSTYKSIVAFVFLAVIGHDWTISMVLGNTLWLIALGYYIYIQFLGFSCLPQLRSTKIFLYPLTVLALVYILTLLFGWNISTTLMNFYQFRVL
jgi:hypothetical protein